MKSNLTRLGFYITILLHLIIGSKKSLSQPCTQAPNISYSGVNNAYFLGKPIINLIPTNIGGIPSRNLLFYTSKYAGSGVIGNEDSIRLLATFYSLSGVALDKFGNVYVADKLNHEIRKIDSNGIVTTLAGSGSFGEVDGIGKAAILSFPAGVGVDRFGNVFVADSYGNTIRKITPTGIVTTIAGSGIQGSNDGQGILAQFNSPSGIAVDSIGNIFVADNGNHKIRKISPSGMVSTFAGSGISGSNNGQGLSAEFNNPYGLTIDRIGNIFVADQNNHLIRKISPTGTVSTFAGSYYGYADGQGSSAQFYRPTGVAVDSIGNVFVADYMNQKIRKISSTGLVTTISGNGAVISGPYGVATDTYGNVYVAEGSNKISKLNPIIYSITPNLPAGLNFDVSSGIISGTPTGSSLLTQYTITTQNGCGVNSTNISFSSCSPTYSVTKTNICSSSLPYLWNGLTCNNSGIYSKTLINNTGCDSIAKLELTISNSKPSISFAQNSSKYSVGYPIAPLVPTNIGGNPIVNSIVNVTTISGNGTIGSDNGQGTTATYNYPNAIAIDKAGYLYIADQYNNKIRKISPTGNVTTIAGTGAVGSADGLGSVATFNYPSALVLDSFGNIYVADKNNNNIRKITPSGIVSTYAGSSTQGTKNGWSLTAQFYNPSGLAIDSLGNLYVADFGNHMIRKIWSNGWVTTLAGNGSHGSNDGQGQDATFYNPSGLAIDSKNNLYVADYLNQKIRIINSYGNVKTFAGNGTSGPNDGLYNVANFSNPSGVTLDKYGNVYVADLNNNRIRKISSFGIVSTLAGKGTPYSSDGIGSIAEFYHPTGVVADSSGNLFVADRGNHKIRRIDPTVFNISPNLPSGLLMDVSNGIISGTPNSVTVSTTYTISTQNACGTNNSTVSFSTCLPSTSVTNKTICASELPYVWNGLIFNQSGTQIKYLTSAFGCDSIATLNLVVNTQPNITYSNVHNFGIGNKIVPLIPTNTGGNPTSRYFVSTFAGIGTEGYADGQGINATFHSPTDIAIDAFQNLYVTDQGNNKIRKITSTGLVSTFAGSGATGNTDGQGINSSFYYPVGISIDGVGNLFVADGGNNEIRKITPNGLVTRFAGSDRGVAGMDDGSIIAATFHIPTDLTLDSIGNIYVADASNNEIRKISTSFIVSTIAGNGSIGSADAQGRSATFSHPNGIAIDKFNNIYVSDGDNNKIRIINSQGVVSTFAGSGINGSIDAQGLLAQFSSPGGIVLDKSGNLYLAGRGDNKIRKISSSGSVTTIAGDGSVGSMDGIGSLAKFNNPTNLSIDSAGDIFVADQANHKIRKITFVNYSITPSLPSGLSLDVKTGIISGTPTISTGNTNYTISSQNECGINNINISFSTCNNPTFSIDTINICEKALPFSWNGLIFSTSGTQTKHLNNSVGCDSSATLTLIVNPKPIAGFKLNNPIPCKNNSYVYTDTSTISSGTYTRLWNFGDSTSSTISPSTKIYTIANTYQVKLVTTSNFGCKDSITKAIVVNPKTSVGFTTNTTNQCINTNSYLFTDTSKFSTGNLTRLWTLGNGDTTSLISPSKIFTNTGLLYIKLLSIGDNGCKDSLTKLVIVYPNAKVGFTVNNTSQCLNGNNFLYTDTSIIGSGSYTRLWNFGDFTNSTTSPFTKTYYNANTYQVKLVTTTNNGCKDSITSNVIVNPSPKSGFTINNPSQCINGNSFTYSDTSKAALRLWTLANGNVDTNKVITNSITSAGTFAIKLRIISDKLCVDSISKSITVFPNPIIGTIQGATNVGMSAPYAYSIASQANHTYVWSASNGNIVSGQGTNAVQVQWLAAGAGKIKVQLANNQNCSSIDSSMVSISNVGIAELRSLSQLELYPNPNNGDFKLKVTSAKASETHICLLNMLGQEVWIDSKTLSAGIQEIDINTNVAAGVYLLKLQNEDGQVQKSVVVR